VSAADLVARGEEHFAAGRIAEAERAFREALAVDPGSLDALNDLGVVLLGQGRAAEASGCARRLRELAPLYPGSAELLGRALATAGRPQLALDLLLRATGEAPADRDLWGALADAALKADDPLIARVAITGLHRTGAAGPDAASTVAALDAELERRGYLVAGLDDAPAGDALVSIVIPCYGQAHWLPDAVESVLGQTYASWELIVVDDGSPDDTSAVATALAAANPERRIRVLTLPNAGLPGARNNGIARAEGAYILPLDADDRLAPTFLERTVGALDARPTASIAYAVLREFEDSDYVWPTGPCNLATVREENRIAYASLYRRSLYDAVGGYRADARHYEDWEFWLRAAALDAAAVLVPEMLFLYRRTAASRMDRLNQEREIYFAELVLRNPDIYGPEREDAARATLARPSS
jgi:GT2 family glycosyltransferase/Flp pilus assembly protein TadD